MKTVLDDDDVAPPTTAPAPSTISAERSRGKVPCSSASPASRANPVKVPIASKKFAKTNVNTSITAASTPMRPKLPRLKSPASERSGSANGDPDSVGTDRVQPPGLLDRRPQMPDRLDDDRDNGARHEPDEDAAAHPPHHEDAGHQQREHEDDRWNRVDRTDAACAEPDRR